MAARMIWNLSPGSALKIHYEQLIFHSHGSRVFRPSLGCVSAGSARRYSCSYPHGTQRLFNKEAAGQIRGHEKQRDSVRTRAEGYTKTGQDEDHTDDISRATLIWRAIKLPIYTVVLIPVTVGSAAAYFDMGVYSIRRYFLLLASFVCILAWTNLRKLWRFEPHRLVWLYIFPIYYISNDVYDYDTGADKDKKESIINMVGSQTAIFIIAYVLLALGFYGLSLQSVEAGNLRSLLLFSCTIICIYVYQGPPFRLSYQGVGEPLLFAAFGPFATTAIYLMQSGRSDTPITATIVSASLLVGFVTGLILFCSHFHQVEGDKAVGKNSPLVRLGTGTGAWVVKVAVAVLYVLLFAFVLCGALPVTSMLLCALTIPMGRLVVSFVEENHKDKSKIFMAKYYVVRLHALFGAALSAGLVFHRLFRGRILP